MIVKDMLPLSLADGEGFREVMGFIEPGYRIPSRKTLTNCLEQQFAEKKAELKRKLATVDVALTTDCWTAGPCRQLLNSLMFVSHFSEPTVG